MNDQFSNFELTFTPQCAEKVIDLYSNSSVIIEYGSGGSTFLNATDPDKIVITVESDAKWLLNLLKSYLKQNLPGQLVPIHADVGPTKEWGHPVDDSHWRNYTNYSRKPWKYANKHNLRVDAVLIDGRFRVACFLASCIYTKSNLTILFDDYVERKNYHIIEKFVQPIEIIDNRMAVFDVAPRMISSRKLMNLVELMTDPA